MNKTTTALVLFLLLLLQGATAVILTDGLVAYWTCNSTFNDSTPGALHLTGYNGSLNNVTGKIGNACFTDGVNDYILAPQSNALNFNTSDNFSIVLWINTTNYTFSNALWENRFLHKQNESGTSRGWFFQLFNSSGNTTSFNLYDGSTLRNVTNSTSLANGQWHLIGVTNNGTMTILYIDGVAAKNSTTAIGTITNEINITLGKRTYYGANRYDEIGIWNRTLTSTEITQLYNLGGGTTYPFYFYAPNITNVTCTSCNPPDNSSPYATDDTTPTFNFSTNISANCRIGDENVSYTVMNSSRDCTTGQGELYHVCTLTTQDELVTATSYVYVNCISGLNETVKSLLMDITSLDTNATRAIEDGIEASLIWPGATVYTNQKVYLRSLNNTQRVATIDKVAAYGNQRWILNYINETENATLIFNITPVVYVLEMHNMTPTQIRSTVTAYINSTKN